MQAAARRARFLVWSAIGLFVAAVVVSGASETASDVLGLLAGLAWLAVAWMYWEARQASGGSFSILWPVGFAVLALFVVAANLIRLLS